MPRQIKTKIGRGHAGFHETGLEFVKPPLRTLKACCVAHDADIVPHHFIQRFSDRVEVACRLCERSSARCDRCIDRCLIRRLKRAVRPHPGGHQVTRNAAEYR